MRSYAIVFTYAHAYGSVAPAGDGHIHALAMVVVGSWKTEMGCSRLKVRVLLLWHLGEDLGFFFR